MEEGSSEGGVRTGARCTYIVTSYRETRQVFRLVKALRAGSPGSRVIVSHDRKSRPLDASELASARAEYLPTARPVQWGDGSYLHSLLDAIRQASPQPEDWVVLLSAQDYPLRPLRDFEDTLEQSDFDMMLEEAPDDDLLQRYTRRAYYVPAWAERRAIAAVVKRLPGLAWHEQPHNLPSRVERPRLRTPFGRTGLALCRGGDLFAINGKAADALLNTPPSLLRYYDTCSIPSESLPHTVLRNTAGLRNLPELLHFTRWEGSPHPEWLGVEDLPDMLASGKWFARKFLPDDPVLDRLDEVLDRPAPPDGGHRAPTPSVDRRA